MYSYDNQIRARFDEHTITVYQAYNRAIAASAVEQQTFVAPPYKVDRMSWIKPSFLWMMYRSGWATKPDQERVLAIRITREGFEWALQNACLSHFDPEVYASPEAWQQQLRNVSVRIQWDPERDIHLNKLDHRAIQIGLSGVAVEHYLESWITEIMDVTDQCVRIQKLLGESRVAEAVTLLPTERIYAPNVK